MQNSIKSFKILYSLGGVRLKLNFDYSVLSVEYSKKSMIIYARRRFPIFTSAINTMEPTTNLVDVLGLRLVDMMDFQKRRPQEVYNNNKYAVQKS